jgi:hypothetical protein
MKLIIITNEPIGLIILITSWLTIDIAPFHARSNEHHYSYEGGGRHGHLIIIMTNDEYFAISANVFPVPDNPGASPEVVVGMTAAVITELTRLHREATQVYRTFHNVDQAIKKLILEAVDDA